VAGRAAALLDLALLVVLKEPRGGWGRFRVLAVVDDEHPRRREVQLRHENNADVVPDDPIEAEEKLVGPLVLVDAQVVGGAMVDPIP